MDELKLRILIVEDIQDDAELAARELLQDGLCFDWRRVEDEAGFLRELAEFSPDVILSDYTMPGFDAMSALRILQETGREIPFILVTGSQSEETAAAVMREGADDYILKSSLVRLPSSVRHALERWGTKRALRESEERWQFALEGAGDGVWDGNPQTGAVYFSPQWKAMLGYAEEEIEPDGSEWERRIHPEDREETLAQFEAYLQGRAPAYRSEYRLLCKDGSYKWTLSRGKVIRRDAKGRPLRVIGAQSDITERKRVEEALRESETQYRQLIETMQDGVYRSSHEGKFLEVNPAMVKILGYANKEELLAIDIKSQLYFAPEDRESAALAEKLEEMGVFRLRKKDGSEIWVEDHGRHVVDDNGTVLYHEGVLRDITERKQLEERIRQVRSDLLFAVSHDLKSPLQALNQTQEMLSELTPEEGLARFQEYGAIWRRNLQRLERMINNLIDSQRGEEGRFPLLLTPCDPAELVKRVAEDLTGYALAFQVTFDLNLQSVPEGSCDEEALARVVENLLTNAVKFSPKGGRVEVHLTLEDRTLLLEVEDHGLGIPAQEQGQLFQSFQRGRSAEHKGIPGTGLGLYVSRRIVEEHGGTLTLTSEEGKGTKVIVRLPV